MDDAEAAEVAVKAEDVPVVKVAAAEAMVVAHKVEAEDALAAVDPVVGPMGRDRVAAAGLLEVDNR